MSITRRRQPVSITDVREWYEGMVESIIAHRAETLAALRRGMIGADSRFYAMTDREIDAWFEAQRSELDNIASLNLLASAEATLQDDYDARIAAQRKDPLTQAYGGLRRRLRLAHWFAKKPRPDVNQHLLETIRAAGIVDKHALKAGFPDEAGDVNSLVAKDLSDIAADDLDESYPAGPPHLEIRSDADLERLLLSRIDDPRPSIEATPAFWADLRREMERRADERKLL